mgnify:FL=1
MTNALRYEWTRIRTLRSTYWLVGVGLLLTAAVGFILAFVTRDEPLNTEVIAMTLTGGGDFATFIPIFMAIIGIFATGHEYRHGLIQPTLTALPQRSTLMAAKLLVVSALTVAVVTVSLAINTGIGAIFWGGLPDFDEPLNQVIPGYFVMVLLYAIIGLALAQLFRGVPAALVVLFVVPLVLEQIIMGLAFIPALDWMVPVVKFLPFLAASRLVATQPFEAGPGAPDFAMFDRWQAGGVFGLYVLAILAVAWFLFQKRDA